MILNGLIHAVQGAVKPHVGIIEPFITQAISDMTKSDPIGVRLACGLVSDLSYHLSEEEMSPFIAPFINALLKNLKSVEMSIDSKLVAIVALGDLLMTARDKCSAYTAEVMEVIKSASDMSLQQSVDEDELQTFVKLRESLCEAYTAILHGLPESDSNNRFAL